VLERMRGVGRGKENCLREVSRSKKPQLRWANGVTEGKTISERGEKKGKGEGKEKKRLEKEKSSSRTL